MDTAVQAGLRWLPLTGWPRPACPSLPARVAEIATIVREAIAPGADPLSGAAHALNKAALLASDCGLESLARDLCWQHINSYREASRPLTVDLARRMLGPALNLARLKLRAGKPGSALRLLEAVHTAVAAGSDLIIDGQVLPIADLAGSPDEHARLRNIVRQLYLTDGIRAHAMADRWDQAATLAEELGGVTSRLTEGRQAVIIARCLDGNLNGAHCALAETAATDPWEGHVGACLTVLASSTAEAGTTGHAMTSQFLADKPAPRCVLFWARLGLTIAALAGRADPEGAEAVIDAISEQAIQAADGYAARDIIQSRAAADMLEGQRRSRLTELVAASGLGCEALPAALLGPFNDAVTAALATQAERLATLPEGSRS
jgi:hypothetical protein